MGSYYTDELMCEKQINELKKSFGPKKIQCMEELCKFKTKAADEYWTEMLSDENALPYVMMCRSDKFSDYFSRKLGEYIDRAVNGDMSHDEMEAEGYFLLNACLNKESDNMIEVCRKIARNYDKLRSLDIRWDNEDFSGEKRYVFLSERRTAEINANCESDFFSVLTDILIMTMANAVVTDGKDETFLCKVKELYNDYPHVYTSAGFFAYFIKDSSEAYEVFEKYTLDPIDYPKLMWVLDGLEFDNDNQGYTQGTPTVFTGPENNRTHFLLPLDTPDIRWFRFFAEKCRFDAELSSVSSPYYIKEYCRKFSIQLYRMMDPHNDEIMALCREYFLWAAYAAGNRVDYAALKLNKGLTDEEFLDISEKITDRIISGKQCYCFDVFINTFYDINREVKLKALSAAAEKLSVNDNSESLSVQRNKFLGEVMKMQSGSPSIFDAPSFV